MSKKIIRLLIVIGIIAMLAIVISLPPVWSHIGWRLDNFIVIVYQWLRPPEKATFAPSGSQGTPLPTNTPTSQPTPTPTLEITPTPTMTPTLLPPTVYLEGVKYVDQHGLWNYCAPANLAMELSYWGWQGTRTDIGHVVKPFVASDGYEHDKNVMPYELVDYVNEYTSLRALTRMGGNLQLLKDLLANGFPVLVEKGVFFRETLTGKITWMGHFNVVIGYDDASQQVITMDSYVGGPEHPEQGKNYKISYSDFTDQWRDFNFTFIVAYKPEKENDLLNTLGPLAEENTAYELAAQNAELDTQNLSGLELFMAWFNLGTSRYHLFDYIGAADAYDEAFRIYDNLPEDQRPYRMLWYQTGPYFAYFNTNQFQRVIDLATTAIELRPDPYIEESWYWRGYAKYMIGDTNGAVADLQKSLEYHPGFEPSITLLQQWGY